MRPLRLVLPLTLTGFALSACSFSFGYTVSPEDLADAAADALETQLGERPEVDCGDEDITPEEGDEVDCTATDPTNDQELDVVVTFTGVDGDQWDIEVESFPAGGEDMEIQTAEPTEEETEDTGSAPTGEEISSDELATAAEDALEAQVGQRPEIDCGETSYVPDYGKEIYCTLIDSSSGEEYSTTITFTSVEGGQWQINVQVANEPN